MAVSQSDIKFKIEFDRANVDGPIFKFTDQTNYTDYSQVKGAIRIEYNSVVLWDNLSNIDTNPDIDGGSVGQANEALTRANTQVTPIDLPLAYNGQIVNGEYVITYEVKETAVSAVISNTVTVDYLFELPEGSISSVVDLTITSPSITIVDNTNYTYNGITPTGIPTLKLYYPADIDLPPVSVVASELVVTSFYTGDQVGVLSAAKVWDYTSLISSSTFTTGYATILSNDTVTDRINIPVEANGDVCTLFCCMKEFGNKLYQAKSNPTKYAQLTAIAGQVAFYFSSITAAYECGKTENVNLWVNEIKNLVDCNDDCACDGSTPTLISPINGETVGYSLTVDDGTTSVSNVTDISFSGASVTNDGGGQVTVTIETPPSLIVTDSTTTVNGVDKITFDGAAVTDDGSGDVTVRITGAGSNITVSDNSGLAIDGSDVMSTIYNTTIGDTVESVAVGGADAAPASEWKTKTIVQALDTILFPTILASISTPKSVTLGVSGTSGILEIGSTVSRTLTATFNDGQILNGDGTTGPDLVGAATLYTFTGTNISSTPQVGNTLAVSNTIVSGSNNWAVTVNHDAGSGAYYDNKGVAGTNLDASRVSGTTSDPTSSPTITGVYPVFYLKSSTAITASDMTSAIAAGTATKLVVSSTGTISIPYNVSAQYLAVAYPASSTTKTKYYVTDLDSGAITIVFDPVTTLTANSSLGYWSGVSYKIHVSQNPLTNSNPTIELRNS